MIVNGRELLRRFPMALDRSRGRILGFHTWTQANSGAHSHARIDDFCLSADVPESEPPAAEAGGAREKETAPE
jgi:hypothetical protein